MIPCAVRGAWRRRSLALGDAPPSEPQRVVWLQGATSFVDLRLPAEGSADTACFAGQTSWFAGSLRWDHDVELVEEGFPDHGKVQLDGDEMIETGHFLVDGEQVAYEELWTREPGSAGAVLSLLRPAERLAAVSGRILVVGEHCLSVIDDRAEGGEVGASYRRRGEDGSWVVVGELGGGAAQPPAGLFDLGDEVDFDGQRWWVDDVMETTTSGRRLV